MEETVAEPVQDQLYGALGALTGMTVIPKRPGDPGYTSLSLDKYTSFSFSFADIDLYGDINEDSKDKVTLKVCSLFRKSCEYFFKFMLTDTPNTIVERLYKRTGLPPKDIILIHKGQKIEHIDKTLAELGVDPSEPFYFLPSMLGGGPSILTVPDDMFDRGYDYDFTKVDDSKKSFKRGGLPYHRPCGCHRYALKVTGKYDEGKDVWLGSSNIPGEWAVSYHGTSNKNAESIVKWGLEVGVRNAYGRGIYCTPDARTALKYSDVYRENKT